ncbi:3'(2'),5'-bisphosphate nucleotidase CysQ [Pseudonocardia endophytica]|uniref:3'(2'),5'-bisphosphate nucleotidase CysQ n=1 Tax=Pseudonocardia endophytica TaxID=401976 RepID=UPI00105093A1|nr:3'(2'),5'-bisphosphate nucleotidase CysQ [Pseudonocardia endophytica]
MEDDAAFARRIADEAGALLLRVRRTDDPEPVGDRGDRAAQDLIAAALAEFRPDDAVLSEEALDDPARLDARRVWIIDPLDGTREFAEAGRHDWAVHVALWEDGELSAGAVALPAVGTTLDSATIAPPLPMPDPARVRVAVSRTRPPSVVDRLAERMTIERVALGSAGYKVAAVMLGEADAYVHAGGQHEWDSAAPVVVARAAGLHTCRLDGSPLLYNRRDPSLPDLVVCRPELADDILGALNA